MKELVRKIRLLEPVDSGTVKINRDYYFPNAYTIDLPLDSTPDHIWQDVFEREWKSTRHLWDRKLFIVGDRLRLITSPTDIEDKLDWVKQVVEQTNNRIDDYQKEMENQKTQLDERAEKTNFDAVVDTIRKHLGSTGLRLLPNIPLHL